MTPKTISASCSDDVLSAAVAVVAGYFVHYEGSVAYISVSPPDWNRRCGMVPPYSTSADAVLPLLEQHDWQLTRWGAGRSSVDESPYWINLPMGKPGSVEAGAATFARCACFALLKANGWTVEN